MAGIKPAEVSEVLKKQLEGFKTTEELEEVGSVLQVIYEFRCKIPVAWQLKFITKTEAVNPKIMIFFQFDAGSGKKSQSSFPGTIV